MACADRKPGESAAWATARTLPLCESVRTDPRIGSEGARPRKVRDHLPQHDPLTTALLGERSTRPHGRWARPRYCRTQRAPSGNKRFGQSAWLADSCECT